MSLYTATIQHTEKTIERLCLVQYNGAQYWKKLVGGIVALVMIGYGAILGFSGLLSIVFIGLGCLLFSNLNAPAYYNRDTIIKAFKGKYPFVTYEFYENGFTYKKDGEVISYQQLHHLIDDGEYLYIYVSRDTAYMLQCSSIQGEKNVDGLKKYISVKSKLEWEKPTSLLNFRLKIPFIKKLKYKQ